jgi:hypothetical protein
MAQIKSSWICAQTVALQTMHFGISSIRGVPLFLPDISVSPPFYVASIECHNIGGCSF